MIPPDPAPARRLLAARTFGGTMRYELSLSAYDPDLGQGENAVCPDTTNWRNP